MDLQRPAICLKFRANQFNRTRCQSCFRSLDAHSDEALQASKMNRKITKCGFLYVAPEGVDFTNSAQRGRRWQRRWFALYDDGELSYALDQHADTVPQGVVDMTTVMEVKEAEDLTGHSHSLRVTTQSNEQYYFKADTADDIKWWRDLLCIYSKQLVHRKMRLNNLANGERQNPLQTDVDPDQNGGPTLVQVKNSPFRDRSQRRTSDPLSQAKVDVTRSNDSSFHGTPRSVKNRKTTRSRDEARSKTFSEFDISGTSPDDNQKENSNASKVSEDEDDQGSRADEASRSWTVRLRTSKNGSIDQKSISSAIIAGRSSESTETDRIVERNGQNEAIEIKADQSTAVNSGNGRRETSEAYVKLEYKVGEENRDRSKETVALMHTLRKGWLMLKGRSENEWTKHWVVLAGLSLKMYKDAWAEDGSSEAAVKIDLSDCVSVHPLSAARNYGIEIKCKQFRYVVSALTPGIRDSWIAAIQQNLAATALENNNNQVSCGNRHDQQTKKKRIAYVTPESHRRDACDTDGDEEDEDDAESFRSNSRTDEISVSGRSVESSNHDPQSDDGETATYSGASTPRRRRSLSPTVRRSPVSRVKERDTSRRQRSPAQVRTRSPSDNRANTPSLAASNGATGGPVLVQSEVIFDARSLTSESARVEANVIAMLQSQLETVRQELERTRSRLTETETENERLRVVTNGAYRECTRNGVVTSSAIASAAVGDSEAELDRLRRTLQEAERDIWSKQEEIELLTRKLDYSVSELSDTETVLSSSLQDLDSERAKFSSLSEDWSRRVNAMEKQLRETIRRLDERERELMNERSSDQQKVKEVTQHQRRRPVPPVQERNDILVAQLESKLAESEAKIAALTQKLQDSEASSARTNGDVGQAASATVGKLDGSKKTANEDGESEIRFESLRHYCNDQNRRLLATLRNETEFLQTMVETKLNAMSNVSSNRSSIVADLKELSDDLIAVHQYIGEIDRHMQPDKSSPNEFMKDFNFKDVLNRLVEVQERFASLTKRDDALSAVRDSDSSVCLENGEAARISSSMHDLHESAESSVSKPLRPSRTNQNLEPAVPFSTYWDYSVSALHADLARSLASCLERKFSDSTRCTVLTSDDFRNILTETMSLEACLLTEIANIIEASKNEERLRTAVKLRDVRNAYVVLRRLDDFLKDAGDDRRMLSMLEQRLDINFFNILCDETKSFVTAHLNELISTLPSSWREKLRFGPADSDARVAALKALAKNLLRDLTVFESSPDTARSCSMELLRSTILKDEITHILSRVETNLDTFDTDSALEWRKGNATSVVAEAADLTLTLCNQMTEKIGGLIAGLMASLDGDEDMEESEVAKEAVRNRMTNFLGHLKQPSSSNGATPLNAAVAKMIHIEGAFQKEMDELGSWIAVKDQSDVPLLASLTSARAIVRGYRSWVESVFGSDLNVGNIGSRKTFDFRQCPVDSDLQKVLTSGSKLAECVAHYEPLTKQLFYRILSNIGTKLVSVQLSVFYECRMRDMASLHEGMLQRALQDQQCEWCGNRKTTGKDGKLMDDGSFIEESSDDFGSGPLLGLRSKEELEHWRRLVPSDGGCGAPTNLAGEVAELEQEILEMQSFHNEELEALRAAHVAEVESLKRELATEQERRRKLYNDMESMKSVTDHSLATLDRAHSQLIDEIRGEHRQEVERLAADYERSLKEEKEATRQALDALQKAHESELHKQAEKLKTTLSNKYSKEDEEGGRCGQSSRHDIQDALQEISRELSEVSAAYSTKCLENSRLEDELDDVKRMLDQMMNGSSLADDQMRQQFDAMHSRSAQIHNLHTELSSRDTEIRRYEDRVRQLESELARAQAALASIAQGDKPTPVENPGLPQSSATPPVPAQNGHGDHVSNSSSSSEELDDDDEEDDIAAEYQPKIARRRRGLPNRRGDSRYHSTPNLGAEGIGGGLSNQNGQQSPHALTPDRILQELRNVMGLPVSERRKYFENLCKPAV